MKQTQIVWKSTELVTPFGLRTWDMVLDMSIAEVVRLLEADKRLTVAPRNQPQFSMIVIFPHQILLLAEFKEDSHEAS